MFELNGTKEKARKRFLSYSLFVYVLKIDGFLPESAVAPSGNICTLSLCCDDKERKTLLPTHLVTGCCFQGLVSIAETSLLSTPLSGF
ncbi:MAG: hypothetical protein AAB458_03250 [Patescibacteria group bacterium]